jgi:hypothetical protein
LRLAARREAIVLRRRLLNELNAWVAKTPHRVRVSLTGMTCFG